MPDNTLFLKPTVCPRMVLVDGLTRSGKMLTAKLVSNFERMEYFQAFDVIDHIPLLRWLGHLDDDTASAFLRLEADAAIYNRVVGRNLNLREGDSSNLRLALNYEEYQARTSGPDGAAAMDAFNAQLRTPVFFTHEALPNITLFFRAFEDLRVVEPMRHPVGLAYSWFRRGWGERYGEDPLSFVPAIDAGGRAVPWFARDWADDYLAASPTDRVIRSILTLTDMCKNAIEALALEHRQRIHFFAYERMLAEPETEISAIASFLDTQPLPGFDAVLPREGLPGGPAKGKLSEALSEISANGSPDLIEQLLDVGRSHEERWGLETLVP